MKIKNIVLAGFLFVFFSSSSIFAQVKVYPEVHKVTALPGETIKGNIWVINSEDRKLEVEIQDEDWSKGGRKNGVSWLKIKQKYKKFVLKPNGMKEVRWKIIVPKDAEGDLVAQIFCASISSGKMGGIGIGTRVAQGIYITIKGTEKPAAEITDFSVKYNNGNYGFGVLFKNTGNVQLTTKGEIIVKELQASTTRSVELKPWSYRSGESFTLWGWLTERLPESNYETDATVFYNDPSGVENSVKSKLSFSVSSNGEVTLK